MYNHGDQIINFFNYLQLGTSNLNNHLNNKTLTALFNGSIFHLKKKKIKILKNYKFVKFKFILLFIILFLSPNEL